MIIKNISGAAISIVEVGKTLQNNDTLEIDDDLRKDEGIAKLITDGKLTVLSYSTSETSDVMQEELGAVSAVAHTHANQAELDLLTDGDHDVSDGTSHANVVLNDTHRSGDGSDHANVALNDTHRAIVDGSNPHATPRIVTEHQILGTAVNRTLPLMLVDRAGSVVSFKAYARVAAAAGESITVDLQKNGSSVLTSVITLDNAAGTSVVTGTLKTDGTEDFVADDKFEVVYAYTAGGAPAPMSDIQVGVWATV